MFALALLLAATVPDAAAPASQPLPAAIRLTIEVTEVAADENRPDEPPAVDNEPKVLSKEALETSIAPDGSFHTRIVDGVRTRSFSGTLEARRDRFGVRNYFLRYKYADVSLSGTVPSGPNGETEPVYDVFRTDSFVGMSELSGPLVLNCGRTETETAGRITATERVMTFEMLAEPTPIYSPRSELDDLFAPPAP